MKTKAKVAGALFQNSSRKRIFILALCLHGAVATVFGLYSRFNVWDAFLHPFNFMKTFAATLFLPGFVMNVLFLFIFFSGIFFVANRILRKAGRFYF